MLITLAETEADLLADRLVLNERLAVQTAVDLEAAAEHIAPVRIERVSKRQPRGDI